MNNLEYKKKYLKYKKKYLIFKGGSNFNTQDILSQIALISPDDIKNIIKNKNSTEAVQKFKNTYGDSFKISDFSDFFEKIKELFASTSKKNIVEFKKKYGDYTLEVVLKLFNEHRIDLIEERMTEEDFNIFWPEAISLELLSKSQVNRSVAEDEKNTPNPEELELFDPAPIPIHPNKFIPMHLVSPKAQLPNEDPHLIGLFEQEGWEGLIGTGTNETWGGKISK